MKRGFVCGLLLVALSVGAKESAERVVPAGGIDKALLGQILFFDHRLSFNGTQNCATCHNPDAAFIDTRQNSGQGMVSQGDNPALFGVRNSPTILYARFSPEFHFDPESQSYIGGQFWDGRADNLQKQAGMPPLDPLEMGMPDELSLAKRLLYTPMYVNLLTQHYGEKVWNTVDDVYSAMEDALATFQKESALLAPFDSKYDRSLKGEYRLTPLEAQGKELFFNPEKTHCSRCHLRHSDQPHSQETFTNYHYENIGVPSNPALIKHNGLPADYIDRGLGGNPKAAGDPHQMGKFKVPTLRNVAVTPPYMHNGVFKELKTVLLYLDSFNNPKRKNNPETNQPWAEAEYPPTVAHKMLKAPPLSDAEIEALEAFLKTLTDARYE
ncbi:methylamine utilization protein MauG [[Actinobacillus] muris]|uniref:Methylamine utilization protein MauG n=1 Tax=Muribacter muris TaxID=67855 RepID=A0A0J5PA24_9PAST|nr:cytochrome c peroxidase [Muribacter muris]KMK52399.1 methylamine utilization protein MauG [[Actinobacillus] muris] [Muribacter muris]